MSSFSLKAIESSHQRDVDFVKRIVEEARVSGAAWARSWTPHLLADEFKTARLFIAHELDSKDAVPVGFVLLRAPGAAWEITLTAVSPEARKRGVFGTLLDRIANVIYRDASNLEIHLEVRVDNAAAIAAYQRYGFEAVGTRKRYYADGADAVLYKKTLILFPES